MNKFTLKMLGGLLLLSLADGRVSERSRPTYHDPKFLKIQLAVPVKDVS